MAKSPESLLSVVKEAEADVIVGPSAMGLPVYDIPVRKLEGYAKKSKEAAQGAALIASGLADGMYAELVDVLELRGARGTVLDYIRWPGFNAEKAIHKKLRAMKMRH